MKSEIETCDNVVVIKQNDKEPASLTNIIRMREESGTRTSPMADQGSCCRHMSSKPIVFPPTMVCRRMDICAR